MALRNIIRIDEAKCNGCGQCITGCPEGALALVDGKAKLVGESYCDGLGACIGECPTGALTIEQRDAAPFDEEAVTSATAQSGAARADTDGTALREEKASPPKSPLGCPGSMSREFDDGQVRGARDGATEMPSRLRHWPVQLHLIDPAAPQFQGAHVLIAADCTAYAYGGFHAQMLAGRSLVIACPKLDDTTGYIEKLTALFAEARPKSITVARMEVPCCGGLIQLALKARQAAKSSTPIHETVVGIQGEILSEREF